MKDTKKQQQKFKKESNKIFFFSYLNQHKWSKVMWHGKTTNYASVCAAARLLFGGKWCFSTVPAIYNQELEVWGICKAITTGSDPCPCLQFSEQGGEEYIVQQMSQNNPPSNNCAKSPIFHHPWNWGGSRMQGSRFKSCIPNKMLCSWPKKKASKTSLGKKAYICFWSRSPGQRPLCHAYVMWFIVGGFILLTAIDGYQLNILFLIS